MYTEEYREEAIRAMTVTLRLLQRAIAIAKAEQEQ